MVQPRLGRCSVLAPVHSTHARSVRCFANAASVADLLDHPERAPNKLTVNGYIRTIRNQKTRSFASIGDGSSIEPLQALLTPQQAQRQVPPAPQASGIY
jgi:asparaginyl-tRNA synthetase